MKSNNTSIKTYWRPLEKILSQDTTGATEQIRRVQGNIAASLSDFNREQRPAGENRLWSSGRAKYGRMTYQSNRSRCAHFVFFLILCLSQRFVQPLPFFFATVRTGCTFKMLYYLYTRGWESSISRSRRLQFFLACNVLWPCSVIETYSWVRFTDRKMFRIQSPKRITRLRKPHNLCYRPHKRHVFQCLAWAPRTFLLGFEWSKSCDVRGVVFRLGFADGIFRWRKATGGKSVCFRRLAICRSFFAVSIIFLFATVRCVSPSVCLFLRFF